MADDKTPQPGSTPARPQPTPARSEITPASTGSAPKDGGGVGDELKALHEQRITVPGASNVDARLDNRSGADRPLLESYPAKPQQIDGPDVMTQVEHTRAVLAEREAAVGDRKGMFSPGPHGLSDESARGSDRPLGTEGLSGSPKAN